MKKNRLLAMCLALVLMFMVAVVPASAAEVTEQPDSAISMTTAVIEPRAVQRTWNNLTVETQFQYLPTGNGNKIANWYGSYATFIFENKSSSDQITLRIRDFDPNGNEQHTYTETLRGNGGSIVVKVTPGGYYTVEAKASRRMTQVRLTTSTER